jgi:hypothetical protein
MAYQPPTNGHRSAMVQHCFNRKYHIQPQNTKMLSTKSCYTDCIMKEVTDTEPHSNNINREDDLVSSRCRMEETSPRKYKFLRIQAFLGTSRH